jgi:hypothetical protein
MQAATAWEHDPQLTILSIPGATWRRHIGWYEFGRQPRATAIVKNQLLAALAQ